MPDPEFEAIAEVVEAWEPGVAVSADGTVAAVATDVDGVLTVEVVPVEAPVRCQ